MKTQLIIDLEQYRFVEEAYEFLKRVKGLVLRTDEDEDAHIRVDARTSTVQLVITTHVGRVVGVMTDLEEEGMLE